MIKIKNPPQFPVEMVVSLIALIPVLFYSLALFVFYPYPGFRHIPNQDGKIVEIYVPLPPGETLQVGDIPIQIGSMSWAQYNSDAHRFLWKEFHPGDRIMFVVKRGDQQYKVSWVFPGFNWKEFWKRMARPWWIAYIFWFAGTITLLLVRPKDKRRTLLATFDFLTAAWISAGFVSQSHLWLSSLVTHSAIWLSVPVALHLHWNFPWSLGRAPRLVWWLIYLAGFAFAAQMWIDESTRTYMFGAILVGGGSLALLFAHGFLRPSHRNQLRLLIAGGVVAILPGVALAIVRFMDFNPQWLETIALTSLAFSPAAYFYALYWRQLGELELRASRLISYMIYVVLLLALSSVVISFFSMMSKEPGTPISTGIIVAVLIGLITAATYPAFQHFIDHNVLGMPLPPTHLVEDYTTRITTSLETERLATLLRDEVLPTLLVRQATLLRLNGGNPKPIFSLGIDDSMLPDNSEIPALLANPSGLRFPPSNPKTLFPCPWARVILKLSVEGQPVGLCLLGRRDPDDRYAASEIPTLQALMDHTALALKNIEQAGRLRTMYQNDIERQEIERTHLARELHDEILAQLAMLSMSTDERFASPEFNKAYQATTTRIREMISGLRPAMLNYGLRAALDELVDEVMNQTGDAISIKLELPPSEIRYPVDFELHTYRIVQQACQNAIKHAQAKRIFIQGQLAPELVELEVKDDGIGFAAGENMDLSWLLANRHFGLAGMHERAALIGAQLQIASGPGQGTRVKLIWSNNHPHASL